MSRQRDRNALRQSTGARNCFVGTAGVESPKISQGELSHTEELGNFSERHENPDFPHPHRPHKATETWKHDATSQERARVWNRRAEAASVTAASDHRARRRMQEQRGSVPRAAKQLQAQRPAAAELPWSRAGLPSSRLLALL